MKKKEVLVIFVLAVLVTMVSWLYNRSPLPTLGVSRGFPFIFYYQSFIFDVGYTKPEWLLKPFVGNALFWFLVLVGGWWIVKRLKMQKLRRWRIS